METPALRGLQDPKQLVKRESKFLTERRAGQLNGSEPSRRNVGRDHLSTMTVKRPLLACRKPLDAEPLQADHRPRRATRVVPDLSRRLTQGAGGMSSLTRW